MAESVRFSAPDPDAPARGIVDAGMKWATAVQAGEALVVVAAADLGSMLTTARLQAEAVQMLGENLQHAEANAWHEPAGWFWNAYATAQQ
jgi:hypothetical protein